ncbi:MULTISPECIES: PKD domain-containing protein [Halolamina]|uniref:PKD domain-containing protein n=1 Tax=Halolamina TaxID=1075397 RepID=UPI0009429C8A|nr:MULTISPECIES: PKD domain-containing protein [Halolamina]NHX36747.1 PKD domain-containing protein [Halolamina sp. R1-12]
MFTVTNKGTDQVRVRIRDDTSDIAFYTTIGETQYRLDGTNVSGAPLPVGAELNVSVRINSENASAIESVDTITIDATADEASDRGADDNESTPPPGGSDGAPTTNIRNGELQLTGTAESGDSLRLDLATLPNASGDRIEAQSIRINYTEQTSLRTTVDLNSTAGNDSGPGDVSPPENGTVLTYLNVSHPQTPDSAIGDATFRFVVPHGEDPPGTVDLLRYNNTTATWETQPTEVSFVRNSTDGYVYEARTDSLSLFAVIERVRGMLIRTEETSATIDASLLADPDSSFPVTAYGTYRNQSFNASYWDERATRNADDAAAVIREKIGVSVREAAKDTLISKAVSIVDGVLKTSLRVSGIGSLLTALDITLSSSEFVGSFGPAIQQKTVAIHVDPGTASHDALRTKLAALEENSRELKTAVRNDNVARQNALLREREQLLEDTYRLLPQYVDDVHTDVVGNTAGLEDPRAYKQIRSNAESLRMLLLLDHQVTTKRLYGAPDKSLARDTSMPTHGWTAFNRSEVYDTIDHTNDYVVLRINGSRAAAANNSLDIDIRGTNASAFETLLVSERPDSPRRVEGREIDGVGSRASGVVAPEDEQYLVIRSDGAVGPLRVLVSAGNTTVPVSVTERAGPDIQRPHADLIRSPEPVTLRDGDVVYPTNTSETRLAWQLWDDKTPTEEIEYRVRVDRGEGFSAWTDWQFAPADGRVSPDLNYDAGITRVQLQVRDGSNRTAVRNADIVVSPGVPQTALAAPDDPTSDAIYVRVLPERRIERIELQYRREGAETFKTWTNITDTRDIGRLSAPAEGELVVRARAVGLDGDVSAWATERVTYEKRDTESPDAELVQAPALRPTPTQGGVAERRVTNAAETTLAWDVEDDTTAADELEYRVRTTDGSWSAWRSTESGRIETTVDVLRDGTVVSLEVRDAAGNVATRQVAVYRDTDAPSVSITARDSVLGAVVNPNADEPLRRVQLQVRGENQSEWRSVRSLPGTQQETISVGSAGSYELRARGVDSAGNVGSWSEPVQFDSLPATYGESVINEETAVAGGTVQEFNVGDAVVGAAQGYVLYNAFVDEIDGELLLNMYMLSREGNRIPVSSIELTEERNQTIQADLPGNLTSDAKLQVEVRGNGTVVLASLRAIGAGPDVPPPTVSPERPTVDETVRLSVPGDWPGENYVSTYQWDVDGDGAFENETASPSLNTSYRTGGTRNVTVAVTDVFGATRTANATVSVNSPPEAVLRAPTAIKTGEVVTLDAGGSTDPDGNLTAYRWSIDGADDRTGSETRVSFADDGTYSVTLVVEDEDGATDRVTRAVSVENRPPQVTASVNETDPLVGEGVRFSADGSLDTDGSITEVAWDLDADGTYERSGSQITKAFEEPGDKTIGVRVTDDDGATNTTTVRVHVNVPPESRLNTSSPVLTNETVVVDATESTDPDGTIAAYQWEVAGPAAVPDGTTTDTLSYPDDGVYPVTVTVVDDDGAIDTVTRNVTVENRPPEVNGEVVNETPVVGEPVEFTAAGSTDPDGTVVSTGWDTDGDGTVETNGTQATAVYDSFGVRTATVTVTDDDGATSRSTVSFYVNAPPRASIGSSSPALTDEPIRLRAIDDSDPDGQIVEYAWDTDGDGTPEADGNSTTVSFSDDGTYSVALTVTDNNGTATTVTRNLTVRNRPPRPVIDRNVTVPLIEEPVRFEAANSTDPDGSVTAYEWDLDNDGEFDETGATVMTAFAESGNNTVTLRVIDDDGSTNTTAVRVHVNVPPESRLNTSGPVLTNETVVVDATESADPDGSIVAYQWETAGPATVPDGARTDTLSYRDDGVYAVSVTVVDDDGAVDTVTRNVTVENRPPEVNGEVVNETPVVGEPVEFTAAGSVDPDGSVVGTGWDTDDDGAVEVNGTQATAVYDSFGVRTATVTVTDDDGAANRSTVAFYVNAPPRASISSSGPALTDEPVQLRAVNGSDPDGRIIDYRWDVDDDGAAEVNGSSTTVSFPDDGTYPVALTVVDNNGTATTVTRNVTVRNRPPRPVTDRNVTVPLVDELVEFEAAGSTDPDGSVTAYEWDLDGDGEFDRTGATVTTAFAESGNNTVTLRVTDDDGSTNTTNVTVRVNEPPVANITGPLSVPTGETLELTAAGSFDPDGRITEYVWHLRGRSTTGQNLTTEFHDDGNYTVNLTVTDDAGATTTVTRVVEVTNRPPSATLSRINESDPVTVGQPIAWNTSVGDADGTIDNVTLRLSPPSDTETTRFVPVTGAETEIELNESGAWNLTLVAVDDDGARTVRCRTVDVNARPVAEIGVSKAPVAGEPVTLTAFANDSDGTVESYEWVVGNRTLTGRDVTFTPETAGERSVTLVVTDDDGAERVVRRTVEIDSPLDAEVYIEQFFGGHILSAYADIDTEDPGSVRYRWDVDDDGEYEATGGERVVSEPGTYEFTVRATNTETNKTVVANETVTVESLPADIRVNWTNRDTNGGELAADHGQVYVPAGEQGFNEDPADASLTALSSETGTENWDVSLQFNPSDVRTTDDAVYAIGRGIARIDPDTGTVRWAIVPDGNPEFTFTEDRLFISSEESVTAIDIATGETVWNRSGIDVDEQLVSDGRLVIADQEYGFPGESTLVAYDTTTGDVLWNRTDNGTWDLNTAEDGPVIASDDGEIRAYDAGTGTLDWATMPQPNGSTSLYIDRVVVRNGTIVVRGDDYPRGYVVGLAFDGSVEWSLGLNTDQQLAPGTDRVYAIGGGNATAIEPSTGTVQWDRNVPIESSYPTTVGDSLRPIVVADYGLAIVLDPATGETLWRGPTGGAIYRATYADGTIYIATDDGTYAVELLSDRLPSD